MIIYLITHAHTEQVPEVVTDAWQLSARGEQQAEELAHAPFWRDVHRIVLSSETKTWLTVARVVESHRLPVWVDSRLDELRRTGWSDDYARQVARSFAEPDIAHSGWESVRSVRERAVAALDDLERRFAGEALAIVGHGICLSVVRSAMLGQELVEFSAWQRLAFASMAKIELQPPSLLIDFPRSAESVR
jgi:broad specificity phosphatase PhoE